MGLKIVTLTIAIDTDAPLAAVKQAAYDMFEDVEGEGGKSLNTRIVEHLEDMGHDAEDGGGGYVVKEEPAEPEKAKLFALVAVPALESAAPYAIVDATREGLEAQRTTAENLASLQALDGPLAFTDVEEIEVALP